VVRPLQAFLRLESASGIVLLLCAVVALVWANADEASYLALVDFRLASVSLRGLVNDGLMTVFFFVVGLEIKRELVVGELNSAARATLPAVAALGGMAAPAIIFLAFNWNGPGRIGWGIPMATDIAFCVGVLRLLRDRVPRALVVFVTALAIFDDIGGILVIAFFYGHGLNAGWLLGALGVSGVAYAMNHRSVASGAAYAAAGAALWYALHHGGIHATIAGVILGLMIPARGARAPLERFEHLLHPLVAFAVMPVFALVNAGVSVRAAGLAAALTPVALGAALGLFAGKQIGIFASTVLAVRAGLAPIPGHAAKAKLYGVSVIAGIGFTVALFIATLAYADAPALLDQAKIGILAGSLASGVGGFVFLRMTAVRGRH